MFGSRSHDEARIAALERRVSSLEHLVQQLAQRSGVSAAEVDALLSADPGLTDQVKDLARSGRTIEAIKEHRRASGAGLKEAKEAVDRYAGRS